VHERYRRQTGGWATAYSECDRSRSLKTVEYSEMLSVDKHDKIIYYAYTLV